MEEVAARGWYKVRWFFLARFLTKDGEENLDPLHVKHNDVK